MFIQSSLLDEAWLSRLGLIQNNWYCNPSIPHSIQIMLHQPSYDEYFLTLAEWQAMYGYDAESRVCNINIISEHLNGIADLLVNPYESPLTQVLDTHYVDLAGNEYAQGGSITMPAFSGIILIKK